MSAFLEVCGRLSSIRSSSKKCFWSPNVSLVFILTIFVIVRIYYWIYKNFSICVLFSEFCVIVNSVKLKMQFKNSTFHYVLWIICVCIPILWVSNHLIRLATDGFLSSSHILQKISSGIQNLFACHRQKTQHFTESFFYTL